MCRPLPTLNGRRRSPAGARFFLALQASCIVFCALTTAPAQDRLSDYLQQIGLEELQAVHLETLFATAQGADRDRLAQLIIQNEGAALRSGRLESARLSRTLTRVEQVLALVPKLRSPDLESILLQARHQSASQSTSAWWDKVEDSSVRDAARRNLEDLEPRFVAQLATLKAEGERLQKEIDETVQEPRAEILGKSLAENRAAFLRTLFYAAWNDLCTATVLTEAAPRQLALERCRERFLEFLDLDPKEQLTEVDAESLDLAPPLRARAALGFTLASYLAGQDEEALRWSTALDDDSIVTEIREAKDGEIILLLLVTGNASRALEVARPLVDKMMPPAKVPDVRLARTLTRHGERFRRSQDNRGEELRALGYRTLARLRQFTLIDQILAEYEAPTPNPTDLWLGWLVGHQALAAAESSGKKEDFQLAAQELERAIDLPGATTDPGTLGRVQLELGWARYRGEAYAAAAESFEIALTTLRNLDRDLAVEAAWMRALAFQKLADTEPSRARDAVDAFQRVVLEFADHPKADEARYQIARLERGSGDNARSLSVLEAIGPDDPNYRLARFEIVSLRFENWKRQPADSPERTTAYDELLTEVRRFETLAEASDVERRLRVSLLAVEAALGTNRLDDATARLKVTGPISDTLPASSPTAAQHHYLAMTLAARQDRPADVLQEARWLADKAETPAYRQAGAIQVTRDLEARWTAANATERQAISTEAIPYYQTLVAALGSDTAALQASKNARVANARLGFHLATISRHAEAIASFQRLTNAFPDDVVALRSLGLSLSAEQRWEEAVEPWSRLVAGLPSGSEGWYEARFHELDALRRVRLEDAKKVWKQFQVLHPKIAYEPWNTRFAELKPFLE